MAAASVFLIYREHTDDDVFELVRGLKDYKGYDSALANCQIEVIPWRNMQTFSEIYNWIVPHLRKLKDGYFRNRALVWIFPPDMQEAFSNFVMPIAEELGRKNTVGIAGYADIPKGCGFVRGDKVLVYLVNRIEHELTHIIWGLTWHGPDGVLLDAVRLYEGRELYPWVETGREVTIEGRAYSW